MGEAMAQATCADNRGPLTSEERSSNPDVVSNSGFGNSADYLTARIARDRPDVLAYC